MLKKVGNACHNIFIKDLHKHRIRQRGIKPHVMNIVINDKKKVVVSGLFKNKSAEE